MNENRLLRKFRFILSNEALTVDVFNSITYDTEVLILLYPNINLLRLNNRDNWYTKYNKKGT